jgi:hypothetical protein
VRLGQVLRTKASEYELLAEWHAERAPVDEKVRERVDVGRRVPGGSPPLHGNVTQ